MRKLLTAALIAATITTGAVAPAGAATPTVLQLMNDFGQLGNEFAEASANCPLPTNLSPSKQAKYDKVVDQLVPLQLELAKKFDGGEQAFFTPEGYKLFVDFLEFFKESLPIRKEISGSTCRLDVPGLVAKVNRVEDKLIAHKAAFGVKDAPQPTPKPKTGDGHSDDSSAAVAIPVVIVGVILAVVAAVATNPALLPRP